MCRAKTTGGGSPRTPGRNGVCADRRRSDPATTRIMNQYDTHSRKATDPSSTDKTQTARTPWWDPEQLREKYVEQELSALEISQQWDTTANTILRALRKHDIQIRRSSGRELDHAGYYNTDDYTVWGVDGYTIPVHRLLAVAEYGFDAVVDNHVHHRNGAPWDNRPSNLEPLGHVEHMARHALQLRIDEPPGGDFGAYTDGQLAAAAEDSA